MLHITLKITIILLLVSSFSFAQKDENYLIGLDSLSAENIQRHLQFLASDECEGRAPGTNGGNLAARYIADEFFKIGLKPIVNDNSYFQNVPMHGGIPLPSSKLILYSDEQEIPLKLNSDYLMFNTGQQTFIPVPLDIVFVGYGIIAPEFDYNDYQSVDVEGKIVVFLEGEPPSTEPDFFDGLNPTIYSYPSSKQRIAISRGAAGSILIPVNIDVNWNDRKRDFEFEDITLGYNTSNNLSIVLNPALIDMLFKSARNSFSDVLRMITKSNMVSFPLETKISFEGKFEQRDFVSPNVIGIIEGSNPELQDTYIIISAHYDHLGFGPTVKGDSIYNGALDNAIGVSVLIELARVFSKLEKLPGRSILFMAVTGEEKGLLGSTYYVDHPVVPLYKSVANLNIDGIAMFSDFNSVVGIGSEYSSLNEFLEQSASNFDISVEDIPPEFKSNEEFNRSDQKAFSIAGIPSILILEGLENKNKNREEVLTAFINYMINIYHTPFDDCTQKIDYDAALRHTKLLYDFIYSIANSTESPDWKPESPFINARLRSISEKR